MGFFDSALAPVAALQPLTAERLQQALTRLEVNCDEEGGNLIAQFEQGYFFFLLMGKGQLLNIRGTWRGSLPVDKLPAASAFAESWNREMVLPKTYPTVFEQDSQQLVIMMAETNHPTGAGLTDEQLDELLSTGISAGLNVFEALNQNLSEA